MVFGGFQEQFKNFFARCDRGFINEAIIRLYSRKYQKPADRNLRHVHVRANYKMKELCFIMEGAFGIYHPNIRIPKQNELEPAVIVKKSSVFGDYQLLFDLKSNMELTPYVPRRNTSQCIKDLLEFDTEAH